MGRAIDRLELARIWVPPHKRARGGKWQSVEGHWREIDREPTLKERLDTKRRIERESRSKPKAKPAKIPEPKSGPREFDSREESQQWGRQHYSKWAKSLTKAEVSSIKGYVASGRYWDINKALRSGLRAAPETESEIEALRSALSKAEVPEDVVVERLIGGGLQITDDWKVGDVVEDSGFVSTALHKTILKSGMDPRPGGNSVARILVPKGTKGAFLGAYLGATKDFPEETELLLQAGQRFRIVRKRAGIIDMEVIQ